MKLHIPSGLLAAISACIIGAGNALALSVWDSEGETTFSTTNDFSKGNLSYVASTGVITGGKTSNFSFILNNTALRANTSNKVNVIYVTNFGNTRWGFNATTDDLVGNWKGDNWTTGPKVTQETLAPYANSDGKITLKATIDTTGTYLYVPATGGGDDISLYNRDDLKATGDNVKTLTVNKNYIDSITIGYTADNGGTSNVTVENANKKWSHEYASVARVSNEAVSYGNRSVDATLITTGRLQVTGGTSGSYTDVSSHGGDLVVGKAGQLFLQTWQTGAIELSNDIILGSSTYSENGSHGALRFGNDGGAITLNGNITLVEDGTIGGADENAKKVVIKGTVSGGYNLSIVKGRNIHFDGAINSINSLTISGGSEVTINNSITTTQGLTVKGGTTDTGASTVTINGNMSIGGNLSGGYNGNNQGSQNNTINIGSGTHSINGLDASNAHHFTGVFNILNGANTTIRNKIWLTHGAEITVAQGASLKTGKISISGKDSTANAIITSTSTTGSNDAYGLDNETMSISHAAVTLTINEVAATELKNKLTDVELTHTGTGTLNVFGGNGSTANANTLTAISTNSTLNLLKSNTASIATVKLGDNATVGVYTGNAARGNMGILTATSLTAGGSASVAGALTLNGGKESLLSLGSALAIQGALNLDTTGGLIGLGGSVLSDLDSGRIDLFTGVTAFNVGGEAYSAEVDARTIFSSAVFDAQTLSPMAGGGASAYMVGYEDNTVYLKATDNVPEPATAALSLLALAGLVARRRRK